MARAEVVQERWGPPPPSGCACSSPWWLEEGQGGTGVRPGLLMLSIPAGLSMSTVPPAVPRASCCCIHRPLVWRKVVDWLSADGVISADEAQRTIARCSQAESAQNPLVRLSNVAMARASDGRPLDIEALTEYVAQRAGLPYLRIDPLRVDVGRVADTMSATYAERHKVLPVQVTPTEVVVATAEPFMTDWVAEVERQSRRTVRAWWPTRKTSTASRPNFCAGQIRAFGPEGRWRQRGSSFEQLVELGKTNKQLDANDQGVVKVVDWLWQYAFDQRASDIHLEPRREQGVIRFRIDGVLHPVYQMPMGVHNAIISRIKLLGRIDVVEKRRPQDGRIKTRNPRGEESGNALVHPAHGLWRKMVMRIFDPDNAVKGPGGAGFSQHDAQRWETLVARPHGIILVTGAHGLGQDDHVVLHARRVATEEVNVSTVEDPIEMIDPASTRPRCSRSSTSFCRGLRASCGTRTSSWWAKSVTWKRPRWRAGGADRAPGVLHPAHQRCPSAITA